MHLKINNLKYQYSKESEFLLNIPEINYDFEQNLGIYGLSGSGKTTLGKLIAGLLENNSVDCADAYILYSAQMSENIFLGTSIGQTVKIISDCNDKVGDLEVQLKINLQKFEIEYKNIKNKQGFELSAGELRKFAICLALSCEPDILILDEPSIGLDWYSRVELIKVIKEYSGKVILISHDYEMLKNLCLFLWVIDSGKLVFQGNFHQLEKNDKLCSEIGINIFKKMIDKRRVILNEKRSSFEQ